jgi:hypothetical protein
MNNSDHYAAFCAEGCVNGTCSVPGDCNCNAGWSGSLCSNGTSCPRFLYSNFFKPFASMNVSMHFAVPQTHVLVILVGRALFVIKVEISCLVGLMS